jgi:hypothetical protein
MTSQLFIDGDLFVNSAEGGKPPTMFQSKFIVIFRPILKRFLDNFAFRRHHIPFKRNDLRTWAFQTLVHTFIFQNP